MSIVVVATIVPIAEHRAEVIAAFERAIPAVHAEDEGCELYALHEADNRLVMIEKWTTTEALATHSRGSAILALNVAVAGKIEGAPDIQVLLPHAAGTVEQGAL